MSGCSGRFGAWNRFQTSNDTNIAQSHKKFNCKRSQKPKFCGSYNCNISFLYNLSNSFLHLSDFTLETIPRFIFPLHKGAVSSIINAIAMLLIQCPLPSALPHTSMMLFCRGGFPTLPKPDGQEAAGYVQKSTDSVLTYSAVFQHEGRVKNPPLLRVQCMGDGTRHSPCIPNS